MPSQPSRSTAAALQDIVDNIKLARSFIEGLSFQDFQRDRRTSYAVVRCLEIISEASRKIPAEFKIRHPSIPWKEIAGAGSVYRHHYVSVRDDLVSVAEQELEALSQE